VTEVEHSEAQTSWITSTRRGRWLTMSSTLFSASSLWFAMKSFESARQVLYPVDTFSRYFLRDHDW
jgi:hypothetical protein